MRRILDSIFDTSKYDTAVDRNRAIMIYALCMLILVFYTLYAVGVPQWEVRGTMYTLWEAVAKSGAAQGTSILFLSLYGLGLYTIVAARQGYLESGSWGLVTIWYVSGVLLNLYAQSNITTTGLAFGQFILLAALVKGERGLYLMLPVAWVTLWVGYVLRGSLEVPAVVILMTLNIGTTALVIWLFLRFFRLSLTSGVAEAIEERTKTNEILIEASR
ncbi:MAG TPA: hypothetical protein VHL11_23915, partial [Phototrophicaceae bacterium]|nr:hypothetical protein [Phototrophicaceae bacterium]